jgi:uncharacterized protein (TIGR03000 family)
VFESQTLVLDREEDKHMFSKFTWAALSALLLPVGMAMAQGHGQSQGHGAPHTSEHAGSVHWSGHPANFGGSHGQSAYHNHPAANSWQSNFRGGDFSNRSFDRGFDRRGFDNRGFAYRYPYNRYGRGFYPYANFRSQYWGYPYGGYGYGGYGYAGYGYGGYGSWYPYSSWYPYTSGYGYGYSDYGNSYPDYAYSDNGIATDNYGGYPPADEGYAASPSYTESTTSRIVITAPPGANIWVEGVKIASGGDAVHTFQTPPLNPDQQYRYRLRATWTGPDDRTVDQSQEVVFSAGAGVAVRFPTAQAVPAPPQP